MINRVDFEAVVKIALTLVILVALAFILSGLTGCRSTSIERHDNGTLEAHHRTLFSNVDAPVLEIEKTGENQYEAKYGAKSIDGGAEAFGKFINQLMLFFGGVTPAPPPAPDDE